MRPFGKTPAQQEARELRTAHNARFNHRDTDPDSPDYLASHDRVAAAEKKARSKNR